MKNKEVKENKYGIEYTKIGDYVSEEKQSTFM